MKKTAGPLMTCLLALVVAACSTQPVHVQMVEVLDPPLHEVRTLPAPATPEACAKRRARVARSLENGLLVLSAGNEGDARFQAANDFHWLTGVGSPDAVFVLAAEDGRATSERLYLHPKNERWELWNGPRLGPGTEAAALSGIADTRPLPELEADLDELLGRTRELHDAGDEVTVFAVGEEVERWIQAAGAEPTSPLRFLGKLQAVKEPAELEAMRAAIDITQEALMDAMRHALPGSHEFEAEARIEGGFRKRGAEGLAFASICGSGPNTCYLHYRANDRRIEAGELLLMDVGAKFRHYCADVTRTIPVDGRFTPRQREIYTLVYEASREAAKVLRPGASISDAHEVARAVLKEAGYDGYFPHSVGHGLGLRVHDAPSAREALQPGMVVTIEPGIYIAEEELGVRIEDDYLITESGAELLSDGIPAHPDELEAFLAALRADPTRSAPHSLPPQSGR